MKKFTQTTLIALLISSSVFSQTKDEPVKNPSDGAVINQASNSRLILLSPADGKSFNGSEGSKPVLFRWTALVPKPKEAVTYRLKVWQLMQGQNGTEVMRSNQPIVTKDVVNITQAAISNLYTGPCKPPYLCDFIWAVEVLNSEGNQLYANSNSYSFKYVGGIGTVTGSGGATVDLKSTDKELENTKAVKAEADNKGNAGNSGMSGGKSMNANGDTGFKYKTYQPGKPIYGNINQSGDVESEAYLIEYGPKIPKDQSTGHSSGKSLDKEVDKGQPNAKSIDKELDKSQPTKSIDKGQPNLVRNPGRVNGGLASRNKIDGEVDKGQPTYVVDLAIEKIMYDATGNITGIMLQTEKGESVVVRVVVAGSKSISGGIVLQTEKGESVVVKVVVAGSNSISGGVK